MKTINIFLFGCIFLSGLSSADELPWYAGIGYGVSNYVGKEQKDITLAPSQKLDEDADFIGIYAVYRLNESIAFELGYADFETIRKEYDLNPSVMTLLAVNNKEKIDFSRVSLSGLIEYPVFQKLSAFAFLGYSYFDLDRTISGGASPSAGGLASDFSDSENGVHYGVGVKYRFNDKLLTRLQWMENDPGGMDISGYRLSLEMGF